ncbi:MAG: hypothetical protein J6R77_07960, partial [Clostridia bacterium]|nr:hypothetical protein [Clostridia bacterium]
MRKLAMLLAFCLMLAGCAPKGEQKPTPAPETPAYTAGYRAVTGWDMGFVAVGTDGRVDLIAADGSVTTLDNPLSVHLNDVTVYQNVPVMVGDKGQMLGYVNGQIVSYTTGTMSYDLLAITTFRNMELVGGTEGTLMVCQEGQWECIEFPAPVGNIVGLAATAERVLAVTDTGLCLASEDGHTFAIHDANENRDVPMAFTAITTVGSTFFATGTDQNGNAVVSTSIYGGVWADRPLNYADGAPFDPAGLAVAGVAGVENQAVVACNGGRLFTLPDCLQCNKWQTPGDGTFT